MTIHNIYVHRGDLLKIHIVENEQVSATKESYQNRDRDANMLLIVRDSKTIGHCHLNMRFRLEELDGSLIRYAR